MRTKDGHYVGSSWIKRDKISRNNYCVAVKFYCLIICIYLLCSYQSLILQKKKLF